MRDFVSQPFDDGAILGVGVLPSYFSDGTIQVNQ